MKQENFIFIISSPSGAGKTSISRKIIENDPHFVDSISYTTRDKRPLEIDGKDYHFVSKEKFVAMSKQNKFLEHVEVFDNYYGSPEDYVTSKLSEGYDVLFDIDWQGAETIKKKLNNLVVSLFILPPSMQELEKRLKLRDSNSKEDIIKRIKNAPLEISKYHLYDYVIINEDFDKTLETISSIVKIERLKRRNFKNFIEELVNPQKTN